MNTTIASSKPVFTIKTVQIFEEMIIVPDEEPETDASSLPTSAAKRFGIVDLWNIRKK